MIAEMAAVLAGAALTVAGWAVKEVTKVESMGEDLKYLRGRVDAIYDHFLLGDRSRPDKG